jgi:hypothetical protein
MASPRIINVKVDTQLKYGTFANAFRIVEETGPDCFLDFMVYSASEEEATVVSRVRVRRQFLAEIRSQLGAALVCLDGSLSEEEAQTAASRKNVETVH